MSQTYFTILTSTGAALHANAQLQQTTVPWTHLALGDGGGATPTPIHTQTSLVREVDRLAISSIEPDPDNPSWIVIEAVIPADRGGYVVREAALYGGVGGNACIAVGNYPPTTKPLLSEGAGSELVIRIVVEMAHTATVTLKIDPAIVIASRDWVEKLHATAQRRGLVRLATVEEVREGADTSIAVTPSGVMQVMKEISSDSGMTAIVATGVTHWQVPQILRSGKKKARVRGVGGGGGAARRSASTLGNEATGGAGGGYFEICVDLTGIDSVPVTVGAAGTVGESSDANGLLGGITSFGSYASATGGTGGFIDANLPAGGVAMSSLPGAILLAGGVGAPALVNGSGQSLYGGSGGSTPLGQGGQASASGVSAAGYGAGAGASVTGNSPLSAPGIVIIEW